MICAAKAAAVDEGFPPGGQPSARSNVPPYGASRDAITRPMSARANGESGLKNESKALREEYKLRETTAGVFRVVNDVTGKVFLGSALDLHGPLNRIEFELKMGSWRDRRLQEDFTRHGRDKFTFEVLEQVEPSQDPGFDVEQALARLEERYAAALDRNNTYNDKADIRFLPRRHRP